MIILFMKVTEVGPSNLPSINFKFPTKILRITFASTTFMSMHTRYMSRTFFNKFYCPIVEIIDYFGLSKLFCHTSSVNID